MVEMMKKSIFATIGIALMTREKAEEIGKKVVKEARLSEGEGKKFIEELLQRADDTKKTLESTVAGQIDAAMKKAGVVTKGDYKLLEKRIRVLENELQKSVEQ